MCLNVIWIRSEKAPPKHTEHVFFISNRVLHTSWKIVLGISQFVPFIIQTGRRWGAALWRGVEKLNVVLRDVSVWFSGSAISLLMARSILSDLYYETKHWFFTFPFHLEWRLFSSPSINIKCLNHLITALSGPLIALESFTPFVELCLH